MLRANGRGLHAGVDAPGSAGLAAGIAGRCSAGRIASTRTASGEPLRDAARRPRPRRCRASSRSAQKTRPPRPPRSTKCCRRSADGWTPARELPDPAADAALASASSSTLRTAKELEERLGKARKALGLGTPAAWKPLTSQGICRGSGQLAGQDRVPLPRPGQPDAEHGAQDRRRRAQRRGHVRRGGRDHAADPGPAAHALRLGRRNRARRLSSGRKTSCARPPSPSRPCSRSTPRCSGCWPTTASGPTT